MLKAQSLPSGVAGLGREPGVGIQQSRAGTLVLLGVRPSEPQFPHLKNRKMMPCVVGIRLQQERTLKISIKFALPEGATGGDNRK